MTHGEWDGPRGLWPWLDWNASRTRRREVVGDREAPDRSISNEGTRARKDRAGQSVHDADSVGRRSP
jgi:hypothetical protein